jgi:hypothetical protein
MARVALKLAWVVRTWSAVVLWELGKFDVLLPRQTCTNLRPVALVAASAQSLTVAITTLGLAGFPKNRASAHCQRSSRPPQILLPAQSRCFLGRRMGQKLHSLRRLQTRNFRRRHKLRRLDRLYQYRYRYLSQLRLLAALLAPVPPKPRLCLIFCGGGLKLPKWKLDFGCRGPLCKNVGPRRGCLGICDLLKCVVGCEKKGGGTIGPADKPKPDPGKLSLKYQWLSSRLANLLNRGPSRSWP